MDSLTPPQNPPTWNHTPEDILLLVTNAITKNKQALDKVCSSEKRDFESAAISHAEAELATETDPLHFYQNVATSKDLREAAKQAEELLEEYAIESALNYNLYLAKVKAKDNIDPSDLDLEEKRLFDRLILQDKRNGMDLPENERKKLQELKQKLSRKEQEFNKNFNAVNEHASFAREELEGIPAKTVDQYKKEDGTYEVPLDETDILTLLESAKNPKTRRTAYEKYEGRLNCNDSILGEILELRREIAGLLKYTTWADYAAETKMAKSTENVRKFLDDLQEKLYPIGQKEREELLDLKKKEWDEEDQFDEKLYHWDYRYYREKLKQSSLDLDVDSIEEYFPESFVVPRIIKIYEDMLSIKFKEMEGKTWNSDVKQYSVWKKDAKTQEDFIGYCYLDLFARENKSKSDAAWCLITGYEKQDNTRNYPAAAMVANLTKSGLVKHRDVVTFFHEFGHVMHVLLSRTKFRDFHGIQVAQDFVETPSQMLENWCWEYKVLKKISCHHETGDPLPDDLIQKLIKSRHVTSGLANLYSVFLAKYDLEIHNKTCKIPDLAKIWTKLLDEVTPLDQPENSPQGQGAFDHLVQGYDAGYYGYLYSLVFAADMYHTVFKKDPFDSKAGEKYKNRILAPGASCDESDLIEGFLGRPPNAEAFEKELITVAQ